jgi:hypothetical protein
MGWTVRVSNPGEGDKFCTRPDRSWSPPSLPGLKRPGRAVNHAPTSSAEVKERLEPHIHSTSWPSWPFYGEIYLLLAPQFLSLLTNCLSCGWWRIFESFRKNDFRYPSHNSLPLVPFLIQARFPTLLKTLILCSTFSKSYLSRHF